MEQPIPMNTISQVLDKLRKNGYDSELNMEGQQKMQDSEGVLYRPEDLIIIKTYRFEGESDPADNSAIYLIASKDNKIHYILDQYGIYTDHDGPYFDDFLKQIPTEDRDEQELFEI